MKIFLFSIRFLQGHFKKIFLGQAIQGYLASCTVLLIGIECLSILREVRESSDRNHSHIQLLMDLYLAEDEARVAIFISHAVGVPM